MKPIGCALPPFGLEEQRGRLDTLRPAVSSVERGPGAVRVAFGPSVDEAVLRQAIETERWCCSFLEIDYDERERVLSIASDGREDVLTLFAEALR